MTERKLILFVRSGCHLCDDAMALLEDLELAYSPVDIDRDAALRERYGLRIPVLTMGDEELGWPFGPGDIMELFRTGIQDSQ